MFNRNLGQCITFQKHIYLVEGEYCINFIGQWMEIGIGFQSEGVLILFYFKDQIELLKSIIVACGMVH